MDLQPNQATLILEASDEGEISMTGGRPGRWWICQLVSGRLEGTRYVPSGKRFPENPLAFFSRSVILGYPIKIK